jgi:hypothetical protein
MNQENANPSPVTMDEIFTIADRFKALREQRDALKEALTAANKTLEEAEQRLTDAMSEAECPNFTRSGKQFIMTATTRWSAEKERKSDLYAALRKNGYDHLFSVNAQTLASFVREQVEESAAAHPGADENAGSPCGSEPHVPQWLDGLVKSYDDIGITLKNASKKSN